MEEALELLNEIEGNIGTCCAITMDPDEVQGLIEELRNILNNIKEQL